MIRQTTADGFVVTISEGHVYVGADRITSVKLTRTMAETFAAIVRWLDGDEIRTGIGACRTKFTPVTALGEVHRMSKSAARMDAARSRKFPENFPRPA
jgi:hypothetical protein